MSSCARDIKVRASTPRRWLAASFIALSLSTPAAAQDDELARIREEAAVLRQALEKLEARIQALESRDSAHGKNDAPPEVLRGEASPGFSSSVTALASLKRNWSQVVPGLPEEKVEALLGKPQKILRIDNTPVWYYVYPEIGRGSVFFNASGKVSGRQAPGLGW